MLSRTELNALFRAGGDMDQFCRASRGVKPGICSNSEKSQRPYNWSGGLRDLRKMTAVKIKITSG